MFSLIYQKLVVKTSRFQRTITTQIHSLQLQNSSLKSNSKSKNPSPPPSSSLIQCLMDSYGLSPETALLTAKKVEFRTPKDPNKLLSFFESIGFSKTHIGNIVSKRPRFLFSKPESNLLPKIQFFQQMGVSDSDLIEVLASQPDIFAYSLEKKIKPSFHLFHTLFERDEILKGLSRCCLFCKKFNQTLMPNVILLKNYGVPDNRISKLLMSYPRTLLEISKRFRDNVEKAKNMGFDPSTNKFLDAVRAMTTMSTLTWDAKFAVYRSFGWSKDEVYRAFRIHPSCLTISEEKIRKGLNFFMEERGWDSSMISSNPILLLFSLEKRSVPRNKVLQILFSKGLVKESKHTYKFRMSQKKFFEEYVIKYQENVPEILKAFPADIVLLKGDIKGKKVCEVQPP